MYTPEFTPKGLRDWFTNGTRAFYIIDQFADAWQAEIAEWSRTVSGMIAEANAMRARETELVEVLKKARDILVRADEIYYERQAKDCLADAIKKAEGA
jgi:hypothetical protein